MRARYVVEWEGRPVRWINEVFTKIVKDAGLEGVVTPHTLRRTAATWLMQGGTDIWTAAGYLGMTVQTLERVYGHHHPGHLAGVRGAFRKMRTANVWREPTTNICEQRKEKPLENQFRGKGRPRCVRSGPRFAPHLVLIP